MLLNYLDYKVHYWLSVGSNEASKILSVYKSKMSIVAQESLVVLMIVHEEGLVECAHNVLILLLTQTPLKNDKYLYQYVTFH